MYSFLGFRLLCAVVAQFFVLDTLSVQSVDTLSYEQLHEIEIVSAGAPSGVRSSVPLRVVDREGVLRVGALSLADAVERMSGVDVRDYGGVGGLKTVSVRGLGAKHTAVSLDGVALSDAQSGQVDVGRLSLDNVSLVSLSIGGADDIFRSATEQASASLLSLSTLRPAATGYSVCLRGGSFGFLNASLQHDRVFARGWSASVRGDYMRSDGGYPFLLVNGKSESVETRSDSDVQMLSVEGNLFGRVCGGDLSVKARWFDSERGLPGAVNLYNKGNRERLWDDNFSLQSSYLGALGRFLDLKVSAKYDYHYSEYLEINKSYLLGRQVDKNAKHEYYASAGLKYSPLRALSFALTSDIAYSALNNNFSNGKSPRRLNSMTVVAAQYETGGFRATASLLGTYIEDEVARGVSPTPYRRLSPSLAFVFAPFRAFPLRLRASYRDSYRVPTFADLYYLRLGNVGLKPEKASQFNLGLTWSGACGGVLEYLSLTADGYYNKVIDKIVALPTMYVWRMMNFGEAEIAGVDVVAQAQVAVANGVSLMLDAGYSFLYAVDVTDASSKNYRHQLPYTPRHSGKVSLSFLNPYVNVTYLFTAVGERYMLPQNIERNKMEGYAEHSLLANRDFSFKRCKLRLQTEFLNVGNKQYEVIKHYPMPRFSWRLSARLLF